MPAFTDLLAVFSLAIALIWGLAAGAEIILLESFAPMHNFFG